MVLEPTSRALGDTKAARSLAEMGVAFRAYSRTDGPRVLSLVNEVYGTARDARYWDWKYHQSPAGSALSCVVEREGKIVAHFGGLPVRFAINGEDRVGVQDVDDVVDTNNRTFQGVYRVNKCRRDLHREAGVDFMYGFAIEVTSKVSQTQYGYGRVADIPRLIKVLDYRPFLARRGATRLFSPVARIANALHEFRHPVRAEVPEGMTLERIDRFDERFDRFWGQVKGDYPIMVVRDAAYLNWRYLDIPHVSTTCYALVKSARREVLGFVVLSENHENVPRGRILDIITPRGEDGRLAAPLIARAVEHFRSRQVALVACWMFPHCHLSRPLTSAGFRPRLGQWRNVMFRNAELDEPAIPPEFALDQSNWFLAMGDSDMS